jgi:hypothetical protein
LLQAIAGTVLATVGEGIWSGKVEVHKRNAAVFHLMGIMLPYCDGAAHLRGGAAKYSQTILTFSLIAEPTSMPEGG